MNKAEKYLKEKGILDTTLTQHTPNARIKYIPVELAEVLTDFAEKERIKIAEEAFEAGKNNASHMYGRRGEDLTFNEWYNQKHKDNEQKT